jgi:polysaccharide chain length determinant protein (PEP-CTERM system associated)
LVKPPETLGDYIEILKRRSPSIVLGFLAVLVVAAAVALLLPPVYRSEATILIEDQEVPPDYVMTTITSFAEQRLQSINQRITSSDRMLEIINKFGLYRDQREKKTNEEIIGQMRNAVNLRLISSDVVDRRTGRPAKATIAFSLSYQGKESPGTVQRVADELTSLFLEENLRIRERATREISLFLEDEVDLQKQRLNELEDRIATFKKAHINELPEMLDSNVQRLATVERGIERLDDQLKSLKEREGYLQTQLASLEPELENDPDERRLQELELQLVSLKTRVSEDHPDMKKIRAEIDELKKQLYPEGPPAPGSERAPDNPAYVTLSSQLASTRADIEFTEEQIRKQEREKGKYERRIETTPRIEKEYTTLLIERSSAREKLNDLMVKINEARVAHNLEKDQKGERFTLIDPPRLPEKPFKPNRLLILLVGVVLGVGAGLGLGALREFTDSSIRSAEALAAVTSLPLLAGVRRIVTAKEKRRKKIRRLVLASASVGLIFGTVVLFHYFVMDLDIFWAKVMRRLAI